VAAQALEEMGELLARAVQAALAAAAAVLQVVLYARVLSFM
jgi:hypothetical protein